MIRYTYIEPDFMIEVRLDGKTVGFILNDGPAYYYRPKGSKKARGRNFKTVAEVKRDIEG